MQQVSQALREKVTGYKEGLRVSDQSEFKDKQSAKSEEPPL